MQSYFICIYFSFRISAELRSMKLLSLLKSLMKRGKKNGFCRLPRLTALKPHTRTHTHTLQLILSMSVCQSEGTQDAKQMFLPLFIPFTHRKQDLPKQVGQISINKSMAQMNILDIELLINVTLCRLLRC